VVLPVAEKRSLICSARNQDLIYSVIHWHHQLLVAPLPVLDMLTEKTELRDKARKQHKIFPQKNDGSRV
jgi:hypothetical protein